MSCFVRSVHRTLGAGEQVADPLPESLCFRGVRRAVGVDPVCRCLLGAFHGGKVAAQVRHPECGQAGLTGAEEISGTAQTQVFLTRIMTAFTDLLTMSMPFVHNSSSLDF